MHGTEFQKTPSQLKDEIDRSVQALHRKLHNSRTHVKDSHSNLFRVVVVLFVLVGNFVFSNLFEGNSQSNGQQSKSSAQEDAIFITDKEKMVILTQISKITSEVKAIADNKARVAPSLQIDQSLNSIIDATVLMGQIISVPSPKKTDLEQEAKIKQ